VPEPAVAQHGVPINCLRSVAPVPVVSAAEPIPRWRAVLYGVLPRARTVVRLLFATDGIDPMVHRLSLHPRCAGPGCPCIRELADVTLTPFLRLLMLVDEYLPIYDVSDAVATVVEADLATTWEALVDVDLLEVGRRRLLVGVLGALR